MTAKQKLSTISFAIATPRMKTSYKGLLNEGILYAFYNVSATDRPAVIASLQEAHAAILDKEKAAASIGADEKQGGNKP